MTGYLSRAEARIRPADGQDAEAVARIFVETWQAAYPGILAERVLTGLSVERQFAYWRGVIGGREQSVFVADSQGVVGFAACGAARPRLDGYKGEVFTLYVLPDRQGEGIGRALLSVALDRLAKRDLMPALLWVLADNPARFFYERLGGKRAGERDDRLGDKPHREIAYGWSVLPTPTDFPPIDPG